MNTGRAVADGFDDGDAVTCDVGGTSAVGEAGDSEPVGDEAGEFDVVDGAGTVVDATLVVVVAASLGTTLLEPASGVPQATTRQPTSTLSEIIEHRHELFISPSPSPPPLERFTRRDRSALPTPANSAPPRPSLQHLPQCSTDGGSTGHGCILAAMLAPVVMAINTQTWKAALRGLVARGK